MKKTNELKALILTCSICGHSWLRRVITLPIECPKCRRRDWNKKLQEVAVS